MQLHNNPVDDKVRGALKRYGDRAALWGLLTALFATGRDHEANAILEDLWRAHVPASYLLKKGLGLPDLGKAGESIIGWVSHRYHLAERSESPERETHELEVKLPRAAYPILEWTQRARPRPNLFDYSVDQAYEAAKAYLGGRDRPLPRQGPVVHRFNDGWTVQDLNTKALLVDEGNHQHICVGQVANGYPQRMEAGEIKIYSLRDPEGRPRVTMTWSDENKVHEASGENNDELPESENDPERLRWRVLDFARRVGTPEISLVLADVIAPHDADLTGEDLSRLDLRGISFGAIDLTKTNLTEANLDGANLSGCRLYQAKLTKADLTNADFIGANLVEADLVGVRLSYTDFEDADLSRANLREVFVVSTTFTNAKLDGANLDKADLSCVDMGGASMKGASLRGTDFEQADLTRCNLTNADLSNAKLKGASLRNSTLTGAKLDGATYDYETEWPAGWDNLVRDRGAILATFDEDDVDEGLCLKSPKIERLLRQTIDF